MNVNLLFIMIATVVSTSLLQINADVGGRKTHVEGRKTNVGGRKTPSSVQKVRRLLTKSTAALSNLLSQSNRKLLTNQKQNENGEESAKHNGRNSERSTKHNGTGVTHITNKIQKITSQLKTVSGSSFIRALASKMLARSLNYIHTKRAGRKNATGNQIKKDVPNNKLDNNKFSNKSLKGASNGSAVNGKNHTLLNRRLDKSKNRRLDKSKNRRLDTSKNRRRRFHYLTHLIYKLNRFYSNISNLNASQHGSILHIPFKRKEVDKLEKLFVSLINKENILHARNRSLLGDISRSKLRSFVNLLTQLNKFQNGTGKQIPFNIEIDSHNTSRKDFVVWDDDQDDGMRHNMVDYVGDRINDLGNHRSNAGARNCRNYRCAIGQSKYQGGMIVNEQTSTGYDTDDDVDAELENLNNKIEHYVLGRKSSPMNDEFKEIEESEKESEWNSVRDYYEGGKAGKWWEKQIFPDRQRDEANLNDPERGYKYGDVSDPTQYLGDVNELYDFSLINQAINGYV